MILRVPGSAPLIAAILWFGLAGAMPARADDDPLRLAREAQHADRTSYVQGDSLACGEMTAWGPWPARSDSNTALLLNRPTPLWERIVLVPHWIVGVPFRLVHYTTENTLTAFDHLGWFDLAPIDAYGLRLPGNIYVTPSFAISGLEGFSRGIALQKPKLLGPSNLAYLKYTNSTHDATTLAGGAYFELDERLGVQIGGGLSELDRMRYYGLGPFSRKEDRSYFERDTKWGGVELDLELGRGFHSDLFVMFSQVAVGQVEIDPEHVDAGLDLLTVHADDVPAGFPGESNGWTARLGLMRDSTDQTGRPSRGSFHKLSLGWFRASDRTSLEYLHFHANAEHFFPLWWSDRTLALRGFYNRIANEGDGEVPLGRLATFSSPDELRGYRSMRFYGRGSVAVSAEYRWPVWVKHRRASTGVDAYLFCDAGQVFDEREQISPRYFQSTGGFGLRLIDGGGGFVGLFEVGFSEEETVVSLSLGQTFQHERRGLLYGKDPTRKR